MITYPYIVVRRQNGRYEIDGEAKRTLGHRIERPGSKIADGIFAEWSWDGTTLRVVNDRYGFYPLYYWAGPDEIMVSPSIVQLLEAGAPRELDFGAIAVLLRLGFLLGEDTPFSAIRTLPPQAVLEWRDGILTLTNGWCLPVPLEMDRDSAIDAYIEVFRTAVARRRVTRDPVVVPLSGGRDSRHIVLELDRQGIRPTFCVTVGDESEVAGVLCRALDLPHLVLNERTARLPDELSKNLCTDFSALEHTWYLPVADHLNRVAGAVYDGIGGDVLSAGLFLTRKRHEMFAAHRFAELAGDLFSVLPDRVIERTLLAEYSGRLNAELALSRFEAECLRHASAANPIGSFHFWNRTRRLIALVPYKMLSPIASVYSPFLDHDVFNLLAALPASHFFDHLFHTETITRAFPRYAHIPFAQKRDVAIQKGSYYRRYARDVLQYLLSGDEATWIRPMYLYPRLLRCLVDSRNAVSAEWIGSLAIYFAQLSRYERENLTLRVS